MTKPKTRREEKRSLIFYLMFNCLLAGYWLGRILSLGWDWWKGIGLVVAIMFMVDYRMRLGKMVAA